MTELIKSQDDFIHLPTGIDFRKPGQRAPWEDGASFINCSVVNTHKYMRGTDVFSIREYEGEPNIEMGWSTIPTEFCEDRRHG